uniref:Delta like non-canonical Notch ligand 1 n=1 Tax=Hippocampus comes TaxID=109280 RepID=A0A3Q3DFZ8_HIPCM
GKCRCKPGWQGVHCEHCIPFPGCLHGSCEKAWQCVCQQGWVGSLCDQDIRLCSSQPCSGNATCIETGEGGYLSSCLCPAGFSGNHCEITPDICHSNPCLNGGNCTDHGATFACSCPAGFVGLICNDTGFSPCAAAPCANGATCVSHPDGSFRCVCPKWFSGRLCSAQHRPKAKPNHGQLVCFGMLALLTCLVILATTGIVLFGRCEAWLVNAKYSKLVRQQREHLLKEAGGASHEDTEHSVNIILPEKIRLNSFGKHYTSI